MPAAIRVAAALPACRQATPASSRACPRTPSGAHAHAHGAHRHAPPGVTGRACCKKMSHVTLRAAVAIAHLHAAHHANSRPQVLMFMVHNGHLPEPHWELVSHLLRSSSHAAVVCCVLLQQLPPAGAALGAGEFCANQQYEPQQLEAANPWDFRPRQIYQRHDATHSQRRG